MSARPSPVLESKSMSDRSLFIVSDDLPALKKVIKRQADREHASSTVLMIRALCSFFDLDPPQRAPRPARDLVASTALALAVPDELWEAVHNEAGRRRTSKKEVVMSILTEAFVKTRTKK